MNLCFLMGKIISDIEFNFVLNSKNISIARFTLEVDENCMIIIKAYNGTADWCYQNLIKSDKIAIQGEINTSGEVVINSIE